MIGRPSSPRDLARADILAEIGARRSVSVHVAVELLGVDAVRALVTSKAAAFRHDAYGRKVLCHPEQHAGVYPPSAVGRWQADAAVLAASGEAVGDPVRRNARWFR